MSQCMPRAETLEATYRAFRRAIVPMRRRMREALREHGLSFPQFVTLRLLRARQRMTGRELADELDVTPGNVTGLVDRLVSRGLVERVPSRVDRRVTHVMLTKEGQATLERVRGVSFGLLRDVFEDLSDAELETLQKLLARIRVDSEADDD
jgi:DNA-binding MarR family transcriptional regulator